MKPLLLILLLTSLNCFAWPGNNNANPNNNGNGTDGNEGNGNGNVPEAPIDPDTASLILGFGAGVLVMRMFKPKKYSDGNTKRASVEVRRMRTDFRHERRFSVVSWMD